MADKPQEPPKFSFSSTSGSGGAGLFGSAGNTSGSSLFGSTSSKPPSSGGAFGSASSSGTGQTPSLFGAASSAAASTPSTSLFGSASIGNAPASGMFNTGGNNSGGGTSGGLFSTPNKTPAGQNSSTGLLGGGGAGGGGTSSLGGLFGQAATSAQPASSTPATTRAFSFGNPSTTPAGPPPASTGSQSLFGTQQRPQQQSSGLFGGLSSTPSTSAPSTNPFGSTAGNIFGGSRPIDSNANTSTPQPNPSVFGAPKAPTGSSDGNNSSGATSFFGNLNKSQNPASQGQGEAPKTASPSLFAGLGTQSSTNVAQNQSAPKPLFGGNTADPPGSSSATQPGQPPKPSLFGNNPGNATSSGTPKPLFPSPGNSQAPNPSAANSSAASASSLFSGLGSSNPGAATSSTPGEAPKSGLFPSLAPVPANSGVAQNPTSTVSISAPAASAQSLFGGARANEANSTSQTVAQPASSAVGDDAAKASNLAASTSGPRPTPQSRLKNKSMDEIITRWASDLTKYQKEFQRQAMKVAGWDQMLVQNSDKIQKLYGSTLEAERATVEVERQLSAVENDQAELEYWLDHYEKQVDEMMTSQVGQGDSLSGPDQERERTYKLAEKLSDRLDEMNKDLTSMVEEINDASSHLSKTGKTDDPLSQIVRVLNGHLSQLQQIDQGTASLQAKVTAAQNASRSLNLANGANGIGSDAVDDFYRSYMGRR